MASNLWEDVRRSLQDLGNIAAEKSREFSKVAADKAEELTKKGRVRMEILQTNREIERQFAELGGRVYDVQAEEALDSIGEDPDIQALFEKISVLEEKKRAQEEKLEELRKREPEEPESEPAGEGEAGEEPGEEAEKSAAEDSEEDEEKKDPEK